MARGGQPRGATTAKRAAVQARVLHATDALLREGVPYADLNIERIATRAGISRTAFYFYFRDKRELLMRLTADVTDELYGQADIWFSGQGDPRAALREAIANIARLYREHGAVLRAIVEAATVDEDVARFWRRVLERFVEAARQRIAIEQGHGRGPPEDARATAFALCWMTERTFHQQLVQGEPLRADALVDAVAGIWVRSVHGA